MLEQDTEMFSCLTCKQVGESKWDVSGQRRKLVRLTPGFHLESGRDGTTQDVIVCMQCDVAVAAA